VTTSLSLTVRPATFVANVAICAALYAVVNGLTAPIGTPWHIGQFRPGVIIPALFAISSGTMVGALGAGIGSLVGDVLFLVPLGQTNYILAFAAGLPANFVGFLLFGYIVNRAKSWSGFAYGSAISLLVGNLIAGFVVMVLALNPGSAVALLVGAFGFTFFWEFTMLPFMIVALPILLRALEGVTFAGRLGSTYKLWKTESSLRIFTTGLVVSIPFFIVGLLSLGGYLSAVYDTWPVLGSILGPVMTVFELGIAVFMLLVPLSPRLAGAGKVA
jgi:hypothetical protein